MIKMPLARAKAATASFPTLLEDGSVFLRIRRTHATGGSNSTAEGGPDDDDLLLVVFVVVVVAVAGDGVVAVAVAVAVAGVVAGVVAVAVAVAGVVAGVVAVAGGVVVCCGVGADGVSLFASAASAAAVGVLGGTGLLEPISFVVAGDDSTSTSPPLSPTTSILSSAASGTLEALATVELILLFLSFFLSQLILCLGMKS